MKVVIAPDKFKDCLTAPQVAKAIAAGIRQVDPAAQIDLCPMADGGEGIVEALIAATGGRLERRSVTGPLPEIKVDAAFGLLGDNKTAIVEMSAASGLALLNPIDRNPLNTTTFGTGELLNTAASIPGTEHIILGIGGSATCDAGIGCAQACGLPIILEGGQPLAMTEPLCGRDLSSVVLVKHGRGSPIERVRITVACDVNNPLYGPNGAAAVFGPQKGATPEMVREMDDNLRELAARLGKITEANTPGAGAAGGLGFGMLAFFRATLRSGFEIVTEATQLRQRLQGADLCITGEGRLDTSTLSGKTVAGVATLCKSFGVPCVALAGSLGEGHERTLQILGVTARALCQPGMDPQECISRAPELLAESAAAVVKSFRERRTASAV